MTCIINNDCEFVMQYVHVNLYVIQGVSIFLIRPRCFKWVWACDAKEFRFDQITAFHE